MSASPRILSVVASVLLLTIFIVPTHAQLSLDPQAEAAYKEGVKLLEEKKYDEAIVAFAKATEIDSTYADAFVGRGDALREQKDYSGAISAYRQALEINPKLPKAYYGRAVSELEVGMAELALSDLNNAMELDRNDPKVAAKLGELLITRSQDAAGAVRVLDKAIELDPENAEAYRFRGLAHAQLRHFDEGEKDLAKAVELKNDDFENYSMQSNIYLFQDKPEKLPMAIEALSKAIEFYKPKESSDPKVYVQGYLLRSDAYSKLAARPETSEEDRDKYYDEVIANADAVLKEVPEQYPISGQALFRKGVALRMQGKYGEAITAFTDAIQQLPAGESSGYAPEAYLKRGICWHYQDENRLARGDFQQAAAMDYTDPLPHLWTGYTYVAEDDYRAAIESFGEAISRNPNFSLLYINRGLAYVQLREYRRAADNFNEAVRVEPTNAENFVKRGRVYMLLEEYQKAYNSFHLATLRDEENAEAFEGAAEALRALGRAGAAETYEKRVEELKAEKA
jgi:tetratricopeptide (TPR) repeat protein